MQNLDPASTQHTEYMKGKPRPGSEVDSFSTYTTLLKATTLHTVTPARIQNQANEHNLRPFNFETQQLKPSKSRGARDGFQLRTQTRSGAIHPKLMHFI